MGHGRRGIGELAFWTKGQEKRETDMLIFLAASHPATGKVNLRSESAKIALYAVTQIPQTQPAVT